MKPYLAAAIQMTSGPDVGANLRAAEELSGEAARQGAELITLPENFSFLGPDSVKVELAPDIERASREFLRDMAVRHQVTVLGGGFPVPAEPGRVFNTAVLVGPSGKELASYQKAHLFDVDLPSGRSYRESDVVVGGKQSPPVAEAGSLGMLGLSICYDLRFPELYRRLVDDGAEVLLIPAAFTEETGRDHWHVLIRARAIENTTYVVAAAQNGHHFDERRSFGHAMIVGPWGEVLSEVTDERGIALARIEPSHLEEVRGRMPALRQRVFE
jgi:predicted amidohydrolase